MWEIELEENYEEYINMIPKIIHYCWFGKKPLPKSAIKCINSWKKFFPDYEIKEWNEFNYDIRKIPYISRVYDAKKYAFVSDYARFDILYQYGGIYFDTDVEVIKSFDDILKNGAFMGCEMDGNVSLEIGRINVTDNGLCVNPGLGIAAAPGLRIYREILDFYESFSESDKDEVLLRGYAVPQTTKILLNHGMENRKGIQTVDKIMIYPQDYFNPLDSATGKLNKTRNTHSIHWYTASWLSPGRRIRAKLMRPIHRLLGTDFFHTNRRSKK